MTIVGELPAWLEVKLQTYRRDLEGDQKGDLGDLEGDLNGDLEGEKVKIVNM